MTTVLRKFLSFSLSFYFDFIILFLFSLSFLSIILFLYYVFIFFFIFLFLLLLSLCLSLYISSVSLTFSSLTGENLRPFTGIMSDNEDPYAVSSDSEDEKPRKKIEIEGKVDLAGLVRTTNRNINMEKYQ